MRQIPADLTGVIRVKPTEDAQQGGLAGAITALNPQHFARRHCKFQVLKQQAVISLTAELADVQHLDIANWVIAKWDIAKWVIANWVISTKNIATKNIATKNIATKDIVIRLPPGMDCRVLRPAGSSSDCGYG